MAVIAWDTPGTRVYETGIDRGVLFLPSGLAVPWNGLTAVTEEFGQDSSPVYFDGMKVQDQIKLSDFSATIRAITYPDEFMPLEGYAWPRDGVFIADQPHKTFNLVYRTLINNDLEGPDGYKINMVYNLTAVPKDVDHETITDELDFAEFEWHVTAVPEELEYYRPTSHIIVDSRNLEPTILGLLEDMLYGTDDIPPHLLPLPEMVAFLTDWYRIRIVDHGDGTFSAISNIEGLILLGDTYMDEVIINEATVEVIDADSYYLSDTFEPGEVTDITFVDHGDGTWTATTDRDDLFTVTVDNVFEIREAAASFLNPGTWRVTYE